MKIFDKAEQVAHGTAGRYGKALPIPMVAKASGYLILIAFTMDFLLSAMINIIKVFMTSDQHIFVQK
jgi:hypothetical protein